MLKRELAFSNEQEVNQTSALDHMIQKNLIIYKLLN